MMHTRAHPLAGKHVQLCGDDVPSTPLVVEDWLDRTEVDYDATAVASRQALESLWDERREGDASVVYGHIGSLAVIAHTKELGAITHYDPWADIEQD